MPKTQGTGTCRQDPAAQRVSPRTGRGFPRTSGCHGSGRCRPQVRPPSWHSLVLHGAPHRGAAPSHSSLGKPIHPRRPVALQAGGPGIRVTSRSSRESLGDFPAQEQREPSPAGPKDGRRDVQVAADGTAPCRAAPGWARPCPPLLSSCVPGKLVAIARVQGRQEDSGEEPRDVRVPVPTTKPCPCHQPQTAVWGWV